LIDLQIIINDPSTGLKCRLEAAKNSKGIISEKLLVSETFYKDMLEKSRKRLRDRINNRTEGYKARLSKIITEEGSLQSVIHSPTIGLEVRLHASEEQVWSLTKQLQDSRDRAASETRYEAASAMN
jgi:hypothetical protein